MISERANKRITIQQQSSTPDSYGQLTDTWSDICTIWASIEPIVGREFFSAEKLNSEVTHRIRIRYRQGLTPDMRISYKDRYFMVLNIINPMERNKDMQIMCKELY